MHPENRARSLIHSLVGRPLRTVAAIVVIALGVAVTGCSIQIKSQPDASIGADTMLVAADTGSPFFQRNFNPYMANKRVAANYIYEPLLIVNNIDGKVTPWLAESYTLPDAQTVEYTIRDGVTWSDGTPFTAADVVFSFELLKKYPSLDLNGAWQFIDSIDSSGSTVTMHLKGPNSPAALVIGQTLIVPQHVWKDVKKPDTYLDPNPVGTGPFTLGNFFPQQYSLDKNQKYWQADKVEVQHLVMPASNTQLDIVTKGYDWAYSFISDVKGTWGAANPKNSYWFPPGGTIALMPNLTKAPFNDQNFRLGLSYALDRKAIGDSAAEGYMEQAGQTGVLLPAQKDLLNPDIPNSGLITQDPAAAAQYFAAAGYTLQGDQLLGPDGKQVTITITTANGYSDWLRGVQEVQKQLAAVGISVKVSQPQPAAYTQALHNGDFDLIMGSFGGTGSVFQDYNNGFGAEFLKPAGEAVSFNYERFDDPSAEALLTQYKATTDAGEQKQIGYQLQQVMFDKVPVISLYYGGLWGLYNTQKFTGWPSVDDPYTSPQTYNLTPLLIFTHLKKAGS